MLGHGIGIGHAGQIIGQDPEESRIATVARLDLGPSPAAEFLGFGGIRQQVADRIGNRAGVPSVPNVLAEVSSYADLRDKSQELGLDLVVQSAYGDSGHTTFFISTEADWKRHADEITTAGEVKVMKRIRCRGSAIEACATKQGTIVGPLMTELVGFKELTPYRGGWCGNEIFATAFPPKTRQLARELTFKFGEQLRKEGYRGYYGDAVEDIAAFIAGSPVRVIEEDAGYQSPTATR